MTARIDGACQRQVARLEYLTATTFLEPARSNEWRLGIALATWCRSWWSHRTHIARHVLEPTSLTFSGGRYGSLCGVVCR